MKTVKLLYAIGMTFLWMILYSPYIVRDLYRMATKPLGMIIYYQ